MGWVLALLLLLGAGCSNEAVRSDTPSPPVDDPPPEILIPELERMIHVEINRVRGEHGAADVWWDDALASVARGHSLDLARNDAFSHTGTDGSSPSDRATAAGYECMKDVGEYRYTGIAENIFMTYVYGSYRTYHGPNGARRSYDWKMPQDIAHDVVGGWMESPGHRTNMLEPRHDRQGIGIVRSGDRLYITQNLC